MKQQLLHFMRTWELNDSLIFKDAATSQACFVRDTICGNLLKTHGFVVSTHTSKSCLLPVYFVPMRNGVKLIMRYNFYDWKLSVETPSWREPLPKDFLPTDCYNTNDGKINSCYLEGFKEEWCYDAYNPEQPPRKFTIEVPSKYQLFVIIHMLKHAYPEYEFDVSVDTRNAEQIKEAFNKILESNGNNEYEPSKWNNERKSPIMSVVEIMWRTYCKIDKMRYDENHDHTEVYDLFPIIRETVDDYVNVIMKFPEAHEEFLMEEMIYNSEP